MSIALSKWVNSCCLFIFSKGYEFICLWQLPPHSVYSPTQKISWAEWSCALFEMHTMGCKGLPQTSGGFLRNRLAQSCAVIIPSRFPVASWTKMGSPYFYDAVPKTCRVGVSWKVIHSREDHKNKQPNMQHSCHVHWVMLPHLLLGHHILFSCLCWSSLPLPPWLGSDAILEQFEPTFLSPISPPSLQ